MTFERKVLALLRQLTDQGEQIMATLQDILNDEAQENTALAQLATAVKALQDNTAALTKQIKDLLDGVTLPTAVQQQVDQAFASSDANLKSVQAILDGLTPPPAPPAA